MELKRRYLENEGTVILKIYDAAPEELEKINFLEKYLSSAWVDLTETRRYNCRAVFVPKRHLLIKYANDEDLRMFENIVLQSLQKFGIDLKNPYKKDVTVRKIGEEINKMVAHSKTPDFQMIFDYVKEIRASQKKVQISLLDFYMNKSDYDNIETKISEVFNCGQLISKEV